VRLICVRPRACRTTRCTYVEATNNLLVAFCCPAFTENSHMDGAVLRAAIANAALTPCALDNMQRFANS